MLVAHIIYRLDYGGLENGLVNLINSTREMEIQHIVICITEFTDFRERILDDSVEIYSLNKQVGKDLKFYLRLWKLLRKLRPDVVHTRNLAALECSVFAKLCKVPATIHSEHGWVMDDVYGKNYKYKSLRKICDCFINHYIALSKDIEKWLINYIGISANKVNQIYNGVNTDQFKPYSSSEARAENTEHYRLVTVGRLDPIKNQEVLIEALSLIKNNNFDLFKKLELKIIGDGPDKKKLIEQIKQHKLENTVQLLGSKNNVNEYLQRADIFILPSINEGISNTLLEAMACELPVIAAHVGGNPEIVIDGKTGLLVEQSDAQLFAEKILFLCNNPEHINSYGLAARNHVVKNYSLKKMSRDYIETYKAEFREQ